MSNAWDYYVYLPDQEISNPTVLHRILDIAKRSGFDVVLDEQEQLRTLNVDGEVDIDFTTLAPLANLVAQGGRTIMMMDSTNILYLILDMPTHWMYLSIDRKFYKEQDGIVAAEMEAFFRTACVELHARYGFVTDEYRLETFTRDRFNTIYNSLQEAPTHDDPPPILCWLNYFAKDYFQTAIQPRLSGLECSIQPAGHDGVFLALSDAPWNATFAQLEDDGIYHEWEL
jgi:hypothetical protein